MTPTDLPQDTTDRTATRIPVRFHGTADEYFRIWIVNTVLTILTLGIYSAWAKVRTNRYMYGATEIDGGRFDYHASPMVILRSRLFAAALLVAYILATSFAPWAAGLFVLGFGLAMPFLLVMSRRFAMRNTSHRNVRFSFAGGYGESARVILGWGLVSVLTLGLAYPYAHWRRAVFLADSTWWGNQALRTGITPGTVYGIYIRAFGLAVALILTIAFSTWALASLLSPGPEEAEAAASAGVIATTLGFSLGYMVILVFVTAWTQASILRGVLAGLQVGDHRLDARFSPMRVGLISVTNMLAILLSLGLLIPWATVRLHRYRLNNVTAEVVEPLDRVAARSGDEVDAAGEEIGEVFDFDFGL